MRVSLLALLIVATSASVHAEVPLKPSESDTAEIALAKVQGKWVRTMATDEGTFKIVKEHIGNKTTVTYYDPDDNVVHAKTSEFSLENTCRVQIFTFFNNVVTAGPEKGRVDKARRSYIYRVTEDAFFEINGMLVGDDEEPVAFAWRRIKAL